MVTSSDSSGVVCCRIPAGQSPVSADAFEGCRREQKRLPLLRLLTWYLWKLILRVCCQVALGQQMETNRFDCSRLQSRHRRAFPACFPNKSTYQPFITESSVCWLTSTKRALWQADYGVGGGKSYLKAKDWRVMERVNLNHRCQTLAYWPHLAHKAITNDYYILLVGDRVRVRVSTPH